MRTINYTYALTLLLVAAACSGNRGKSPDGKVKTETMTVASTMVDCIGVGVQRCLVVKPEGTYDWELFYDRIDGFEYEPGYEYVLSVYKRHVELPPADGPSVRYVLDRVLSRQMKQSQGLPDTSGLSEAIRHRDNE
ncbi:MAG: DUF4377 domain-containing protein [Rikenellaceae bacterium]|nr:DUF4377 domain-containing protein [Rikenellaceae bacterium]